MVTEKFLHNYKKIFTALFVLLFLLALFGVIIIAESGSMPQIVQNFFRIVWKVPNFMVTLSVM